MHALIDFIFALKDNMKSLKRYLVFYGHMAYQVHAWGTELFYTPVNQYYLPPPHPPPPKKKKKKKKKKNNNNNNNNNKNYKTKQTKHTHTHTKLVGIIFIGWGGKSQI